MTRDFETVMPGLSVQKLVDEHILAKKGRVFLVTDLGGDLKGIVCLEDVKGDPPGPLAVGHRRGDHDPEG